MGGLHLLPCTDHKEPPHIHNLHLVPKMGHVIIPTMHIPRQQIFPKPQLSTLCFCLFLFHQWWWSTLQLLGSVFLRFNFTEMHLHSGFNSVLCIHQDIISLPSFALVQEQWCPSGQLFWTAHDARDLDSEGKKWWMPVVKTYFSLSFQTQWKMESEGLLLCSNVSALGYCSCSEESIPFSAWRKLLKGIDAFSEYFNCSICLWGKTC